MDGYIVSFDGSSAPASRPAIEAALHAGSMLWLELRGVDQATTDLLRDVFHILAAPQNPVDQPEDALLVAPDQLFKGSLFATLGQTDEFGVFLPLSLPSHRERDCGGASCHTLWDVCHGVLVTFEKCPVSRGN